MWLQLKANKESYFPSYFLPILILHREWLQHKSCQVNLAWIWFSANNSCAQTAGGHVRQAEEISRSGAVLEVELLTALEQENNMQMSFKDN